MNSREIDVLEERVREARRLEKNIIEARELIGRLEATRNRAQTEGTRFQVFLTGDRRDSCSISDGAEHYVDVSFEIAERVRDLVIDELEAQVAASKLELEGMA